MAYSRDAFATMLLTMALVPNREEYARPYSAQEFSQLERARARVGDWRASASSSAWTSAD